MSPHPTIRIAVIGLDHPHVYAILEVLLAAGAELAAFYAGEAALAKTFGRAYPRAVRVDTPARVLEDPAISLIVTAAVPCDRAAIGVAAMLHGKDVVSDKPAFTSLAQLAQARRTQAETGRIYSVCYGERLLHRATQRASDLVRSGAIGRPVQTIGLGPHRVGLHRRPAWFFRREKYGGILCDIGAHQADQFLHFTGSESADVVAAHVANYAHPDQPGLDDFGEVLLRGDRGTGYFRVDWHTPDGLESWGDGRLIVLGTEGYVEVRKNIDIAGRSRGDHLFLVDDSTTDYTNCSDVQLRYGQDLLYDVLHRTETAMSQDHCFMASELALRAQQAAARVGPLRPPTMCPWVARSRWGGED